MFICIFAEVLNQINIKIMKITYDALEIVSLQKSIDEISDYLTKCPIDAIDFQEKAILRSFKINNLRLFKENLIK
jgi:hypothetical protein